MSGDAGSGDRWERVSELFAGALEREPGEREAWLDAECGSDRDLRDEIGSLLSARAAAEDFFHGMEDVVREIPREAIEGPSWVGRRIGPYEIEEELGRGGMGVVYRARDARLGRRVAIKVLPPWLAGDPAAKKRLIDEARAASAIDHPNIAVLHDVVETDEGVIALVLAHYEGRTLRARLEAGGLEAGGLDAGKSEAGGFEPVEALRVARQIAAGLAAAHGRGIVHRDIKPANVLLTADGRVKILDFGVATVLGGDVTVSGRRGGTVAYMSPEQFRGLPSDPRSDLWSLGVVLHEMVAGERPFVGEEDPAVMRSVLDDDPPPLDPPEIRDVVDGLLAKDPDRRTPTAAAVVEALDGATRRVAERTGSPVRPDGPQDGRADRPAVRGKGPRRSRAVAATALGLAVAVMGLSWAVRSTSGPSGAVSPADAGTSEVAPNRVAVLPFVVRGGPDVAYLREGIAELLSSSLHGAGELHTVDPSALMVRTRDIETLDPTGARRVSEGFGAGRFVLGDVVEAGGRIRIQAALYDASSGAEPVERVYVEGSVERLFNLVDEIAGKLIVASHGGEQERLVRVASITTPSLAAFKRYLEGEEALREGRFSDAVSSFHAAIEMDSLFALAHYGMSVAAGWSYRPDLSSRSAERAVELSDRLPPVERRLVEAGLAWLNGELARAEELSREVLREQPANMEAWYNLGELYFHMNALRGRSMAEAREPFERANRLTGYDHYESLVHLADLAARDRRLSDYDTLHALLDPDAELAPVYRAQHALVTGDESTRRETIALLRAGDPSTIRAVAGRLAGFAAELPGGAGVAELLTEPVRPAEWRTIGHLWTALFDAGRGRWSSAARHLDAAETLVPTPAILLRAHMGSLPFSPWDSATIEGARASLVAWDPATGPAGSNRLLIPEAPLHAPLKEYLLGALAARTGDVEEVRRAAAVLAARQGHTPADSLVRELSSGLRARLPGEPSARIRLLRGSRGHFGRPHGLVASSPFYSRTHARYLLAETLYGEGRLEEAAGWYESFLGPFVHDAVIQGPARFRLAEIHDARGRPLEAARHYRAAIELWGEADAALRPRVEEARERLEALERPGT